MGQTLKEYPWVRCEGVISKYMRKRALKNEVAIHLKKSLKNGFQ